MEVDRSQFFFIINLLYSVLIINVLMSTEGTFGQKVINIKPYPTVPVTENDSAQLTCTYSRDNTCPSELAFTWYLNGADKLTVLWANNTCYFFSGNATLNFSCTSTAGECTAHLTLRTLRNAQHGDRWTCSCITDKTNSTQTSVYVYVPITGVERTSPNASQISVVENVPYRFSCRTSPGRPNATVQWYTDSGGGDDVELTGVVTVVEPAGTLLVTRSTLAYTATSRDTGYNISCKAYNMGQSASHASSRATVTSVQYPPAIIPLQNLDVIATSTLTVQCTTTPGNPTHTSYLWTRDTGNWRQDGQTLRIPNVTKGDADVYTCTAWNKMTPTEGSAVNGTYTGTFTLNVMYPPAITPLQNLDVIATSTLTVQCTTTPGNPTHTSYMWTRATGNWRQNGQTLSISNVTKGDNDDYTCTAWNKMTPTGGSVVNGTDTRMLTVNVLYPPAITPLQNMDLLATSTLTVQCTTTPGNPAQTLYMWTWAAGNRSLNGQTLNIPNVTKGDADDYTCTTWNVMAPTEGSAVNGTDTETFTVNIVYSASITAFTINNKSEEVPHIVPKNSSMHILCQVDSNPGSTIAILKDDVALTTQEDAKEVTHTVIRASCVDAGRYACVAYNQYNTDVRPSVSRQVFIPCAPYAHDSVNNYTHYSALNVSVTFNLTFTAYPPPTSLLWFKQLPGGSWDNIHEGISSNNQQSNLTLHLGTADDFGQYRIEVVNDEGKMDHLFFVAEHDVPSKPKRFRMVGSRTVPIFSWEGGSNGGFQQTFVIEVSPTEQNIWTEQLSVHEGEESYKLSNGFYMADMNELEPGSYKARILSSNTLGKSGTSELPLPFMVRQKSCPSSECSQQSSQVAVGTIAGAVVAGVEAFVIVALVVYVLILRSGRLTKTDTGNEDNVRSEESMQHATQKKDETYENIVPSSASSEETSLAPRPGENMERTIWDKNDVYQSADLSSAPSKETSVTPTYRNQYDQLDPDTKQESVESVYSEVDPTDVHITDNPVSEKQTLDATPEYINTAEL